MYLSVYKIILIKIGTVASIYFLEDEELIHSCFMKLLQDLLFEKRSAYYILKDNLLQKRH